MLPQNYHGMMNLKTIDIEGAAYQLKISALILAIKRKIMFRLNRAVLQM
uniref:Protein P n=1 Tax=Bovine ephemeral fever virus TaxID=11303 RepID=A0A515MFP7_BEFV|nr:protein P' [Bovine ephemeral fever virus]